MAEKLIEQFDTRAPDGRTVRIYVYQDIIDAGHFDDPHATIPGMKRMVTQNGQHVNFIDDQTFKLVVTDEVLKRG